MVRLYGVEYALQNSIIFTKAQKSGYKLKPVITPSGKTIYLQGYEPQAYKQLLEQYSEEEIETKASNIPRIKYRQDDGSEHYYFPDFFIPKDNIIIEVKSTWTYNQHLEINLLKQQACLDTGYNFKFMIID